MSFCIKQRIRFTDEQILNIYQLQMEANNVMSDNWPLSNNDTLAYYRAGYVEAVEAVQWHGFKWWKKEQVNTDRLKEELIDILHFGISDSLRSMFHLYADQGSIDSEQLLSYANYDIHTKEVLPMHIARYAINIGKPFPQDPEELTLLDLLEQFMFFTLHQGRVPLPWLMVLFDKVGMDNNEVAGRYFAKNVLNKFRTANGAKDGTYHKIWNGQEDNVYLTEYLELLKTRHQEPTIDLLYDFLTSTYAKYTELEQTTFK